MIVRFFLILIVCTGTAQEFDPTPSDDSPTQKTVIPPIEPSLEPDRLIKEPEKKEPTISIPSERDLLYKLGNRYLQENNFEAAQRVFERLVLNDDQDIDAKIQLGYALFYQKKYQEAEKIWLEVVIISPGSNKARQGLYQLYLSTNQPEKAQQYLIKADTIDVEPVEQVYPKPFTDSEKAAYQSLKEQDFQKAYRLFDQLYQKNPQEDFFKKLVYLRSLVYPSIESKTQYSQETEQDLITNLNTIRLFNWSQNVLFTLPAKPPLSFYGFFNYNLTNQYNLLRNINNYKVNIYTYGGGVRLNHRDRWILHVNLQEKKGENTSLNVFPFVKRHLFEPGVSARYVDEYNFINLAGYYDSFVARNFDNAAAFFVRRKTFIPTYEVRVKAPYNAIGIDALLSYYEAALNNRRRGAGLWIRTSPPQFNDHILLKYRGFYSTFDRVDPDYFSYRKRWEHYFVSTLQFFKEARYLIQFNYTFSWQRIEDFTNIAEGIETSLTPPQIIQKNIFKGYQIEGIVRRWAKTNCIIEANFKYYIDTNEYETYAGHLLVKYTF